MLKGQNILAFVLIVMPWTLLINMWHECPVAPHPVTTNHLRVNCSTNNGVLHCHVLRHPAPWSEMLPTIHIITPTYTRAVQKAELTRLTNTFLHVPNLHWIVVEDSPHRTPLVSRLLRSSGLNHTHLNVETPSVQLINKEARGNNILRGAVQRNLGLQWLRENFGNATTHQGVVYFADDDNTYSLELFEEMRFTKNVSVWPVAFVGGLRYESPKTNTLGKVYGWSAMFDPHRPFAIDMAGFAINLRLILSNPQVNFRLNGVKRGHQETRFLEDLVTLNDLEPRAENCTKVLVWHTRTERPVLKGEREKGFTNSTIET